MRAIKRFFFATCLADALMAQPATAAGAGNGMVVRYMTGDYGSGVEFLVVTFATTTGAPGCSVAPRFIILSSAPHFKTTFAAIAAAYSTQTAITAVGTGACTAWSNTEDLAYVCTPSGC